MSKSSGITAINIHVLADHTFKAEWYYQGEWEGTEIYPTLEDALQDMLKNEQCATAQREQQS